MVQNHAWNGDRDRELCGSTCGHHYCDDFLRQHTAGGKVSKKYYCIHRKEIFSGGLAWPF